MQYKEKTMKQDYNYTFLCQIKNVVHQMCSNTQGKIYNFILFPILKICLKVFKLMMKMVVFQIFFCTISFFLFQCKAEVYFTAIYFCTLVRLRSRVSRITSSNQNPLASFAWYFEFAHPVKVCFSYQDCRKGFWTEVTNNQSGGENQ